MKNRGLLLSLALSLFCLSAYPGVPSGEYKFTGKGYATTENGKVECTANHFTLIVREDDFSVIDAGRFCDGIPSSLREQTFSKVAGVLMLDGKTVGTLSDSGFEFNLVQEPFTWKLKMSGDGSTSWKVEEEERYENTPYYHFEGTSGRF